jgi:hypothetical protein
MAYATASDVATYMGIPESELPDDIDKLIDRADETIDYLIRIEYTESDFTETLKKASSAQVEYWINMGEEIDYTSYPHNFSIGSFSMGSGGGSASKSISPYAPRMLRYLSSAGLLYAGRGIR